jgi:predicted transcriptional regulator
VLNKELISTSIPTLAPSDLVSHALQLMADYHISHLPVVLEDAFLGLVSEDDLMNAKDDTVSIGKAEIPLTVISVHAGSHFTEAVRLANEYNLSIIPVVEEQAIWVGSIAYSDLFRALARVTGAEEPGGVIVLELEQKAFSFSEISKLVETNDAQLTQLNTYFDKDLGVFLITLKVNKFEISDIVATFQRYEYHVKYYFGEELYENELKSNYDHLMNYLSI